MCFSAATMMALQAGSTIFSGINSNDAAQGQADQLNGQAAGERDAAQAQAAKILQATRRERGAARAAIAASGTALDEFALINEQNIQGLGESDAAMTILTGERRGRVLDSQASQTRDTGRNALLGSVLKAGGQFMNGWKGAKTAVGGPINDGGYSIGQGTAYGGSRRGL